MPSGDEDDRAAEQDSDGRGDQRLLDGLSIESFYFRSFLVNLGRSGLTQYVDLRPRMVAAPPEEVTEDSVREVKPDE